MSPEIRADRLYGMTVHPLGVGTTFLGVLFLWGGGGGISGWRGGGHFWMGGLGTLNTEHGPRGITGGGGGKYEVVVFFTMGV